MDKEPDNFNTYFTEAMDDFTREIMATLNAEQMARILVGYFAAVELFLDAPADDDAMRLPKPVADYHRHIRMLFGVDD